MTCLFATSFPPLIGYSSIVTMSGYVYGFVYGFIIAFSSALVGSIVCFYFCRRWFRTQVRSLMAKNKSLKGVIRTVERRGFRLLVLIRLAPYPFNIMNALLSATHIPLYTFTLATAISLIKLALHVYIGSTLSSLIEGDDDNDNDNNNGENNHPKDPSQGHSKKLKIVIMVFSLILGIGVGAYVWMVAKREVEKTEAIRVERRRRRREVSLRRALNEHFGTDITGDDNNNNNGIELSNQRYGHGMDLGSSDSGHRDVGDGGYNEDQSLFGRLELGRSQGRQETLWRDMGGNMDSFTDSEDDDDDYSDPLDGVDGNDDDDGDDGHQHHYQGQYLNDLDGRSEYRRVGQHDGRNEHEVVEEGEQLDFSAHHTELTHTLWEDDDAADAGFEARLPATGLVSIDQTADEEDIDDRW
ncbi:hypothetical protein BGZ65_003206 [Modicella reniformis]|uniref:Golgi apparatus membrane protein TVP38 n=1 Tax=Modicella reniformis TaxID=1440133 RepID=A0A9P6MIH0_9FUNG|nr:hypothetical protein BGZ65_003206 [Modicella reniformis]